MDGAQQQNSDGSWSEARPIGYFWDARPLWQKLIEFPFRLVRIITYDPLREVPVEEMDWSDVNKNNL